MYLSTVLKYFNLSTFPTLLLSRERHNATDTDATSEISNIPQSDGDQGFVHESAGVQSSRNRAPYQEPEVPQAAPRRETQTNYENV